MPGPSFDEIVENTKGQIKVLQQANAGVDAQIAAIKVNVEGSLSQADRDALRQLRELKTSLVRAIEKISLLALLKLDKTDEIIGIANALSKTAKDLRGNVEALKAFGKDVKTVGDQLTEISDLAAKLKDAVASKNTT